MIYTAYLSNQQKRKLDAGHWGYKFAPHEDGGGWVVFTYGPERLERLLGGGKLEWSPELVRCKKPVYAGLVAKLNDEQQIGNQPTPEQICRGKRKGVHVWHIPR